MNKIFTSLILLCLFSVSAQAVQVQPNQPLHWFRQQTNSYQSHTPYGNNTKAGHYVQSGDAKIYYEVYGSGEPVVLLHGGIVGSIAEMSEFADKLKSDHLVIMVNTRGHGKSDIGTVPPGYKQKAKDLHEVLTALKISKTDIIGFSDGAYTGYQFAADYPQQIKKLVAIGAGEWKKGFVQGGHKDRSAPLQAVINLDPRYWQEQAEIRPQPDNMKEWFKQANKEYDQTTFGKALFEAIHAPVLVMAGENDTNAPLDTVIAAYKMLPNAQLAIIPNAPHPAFTVNFDAVWASIRPFLWSK
ncbi:alpha/beta hydrolase [Pantoea sp.]|uniref:alpha/beta fold hydrolase n=1 Tax=Pantoea sp. TaxID=69393 RepID=UPI0028B1AC46|nr:alpha/beta hydrolase [Pantoea sp.]